MQAEQGRGDEAIVCYEMAVNFNPKCAKAYNNLGVIYKDKYVLMEWKPLLAPFTLCFFCPPHLRLSLGGGLSLSVNAFLPLFGAVRGLGWRLPRF